MVTHPLWGHIKIHVPITTLFLKCAHSHLIRP
jgi:hypothetical protein